MRPEAAWRKRGPRTNVSRVTASRSPRATLLPLAFVAFAAACLVQPPQLAPSDAPRVLANRTITAPNPGLPGTMAVRKLYYGSGTDKLRPEYRDSVTYRTGTVDATPFVTFSPSLDKSRKKTWGFDRKAFPLNARVWYPEGAGPFPLVLVVHGNHNPTDFSDPGYQWLGELLASRGFILASIDENFINGGARGENDGRGWMLLKHLEVFRALNDSAGKPLAGRVDMSKIVLMGHSRGGEAVAVAGAFNRLSHYPDDASQRFDFGFDIKGLVAIAPVDGQYRPTDKGTPVEDVNYLVIHGTHDGDVSTFNGLTQYDRVRFTPGSDYFKSAILMYRANHGQWNTGWNNLDNGMASPRRLAVESLVSGEEQRQFGALMIGGFLEATLHGKSEYRELFVDHRSAGDWLPPTMYTARYGDGRERTLAHFDDTDIDLTTGSAPGVVLRGDSLSVWREFDLPFRSRNGSQRNTVLRLGWNNTPPKGDTTPRWPARFAITVPDSLRSAWGVGDQSALTLSLMVTDARPGPRKTPKDTSSKDSTANNADKASDAKQDDAPSTGDTKPTPKDSSPPDLSVEVVDGSGRTARLALSEFGPVRRPITSYVYRRKGRDEARFGALYEQVLQTYVIPLERFTRATPGFTASDVREIRLVFDKTAVGQVHVDNIGITQRR